MKKKILSIFLAVIFAAVAFGAVSCQKQGEQTLAEKKAAMIEVLSDGKYDKDFYLADLVGTNPIELANYQRAILIQAFIKNKEEPISANIALGWVYQEKYVVTPIQLFFIVSPAGIIPAWRVPEISFKAYLLPDSRVDDDWQKEELGSVSINEQLQLAILERSKPVMDIKTNYSLGTYKDLAVGDALYATSQANGRITVEKTGVNEVYADRLFGAPGDLLLNELGSLAFALRDGKPELVGFLSAMEPMQDNPERIYVYYTDVRQITDFIKTISAK